MCLAAEAKETTDRRRIGASPRKPDESPTQPSLRARPLLEGRESKAMVIEAAELSRTRERGASYRTAYVPPWLYLSYVSYGLRRCGSSVGGSETVTCSNPRPHFLPTF